jgi:hypothetical protein
MLETEEQDSCAEAENDWDPLNIDKAEDFQKSAKGDDGQWNISMP